MSRFLIFSDIDNTLVQSYIARNREMIHSDGYGDIKKVIKILSENQIPLVLCSTKTRKEQDKIRNDLDIVDPYIVENGGAIIVPKNYFPFNLDEFGLETKEIDGNMNLELGKSYEQIITILNDIRNKFHIRFNCVSDFKIIMFVNLGLLLSDADKKKYTLLEIEKLLRRNGTTLSRFEKMPKVP